MASTSYVALLRAVNLPSHNKVGMRDLVSLGVALDLEAPRSLLQSGNLLFRSGSRDPATLERMLESAAAERLDLKTDFFVRSAAEWRALIVGNPFAAEAKVAPGHLVALCLKDDPGRTAASALQKAIVGRETAHVSGRHIYLVYPDGIGSSRLTTAVIEKAIGTRGTARNWNTVQKVAALLEA